MNPTGNFWLPLHAQPIFPCIYKISISPEVCWLEHFLTGGKASQLHPPPPASPRAECSSCWMDSLSVYSTCVTVAKQLLTAQLPNPNHKEWQGWVPEHQLILVHINLNHTKYSLMHWPLRTKRGGPRQPADTLPIAPGKLKSWISSRIPVL